MIFVDWFVLRFWIAMEFPYWIMLTGSMACMKLGSKSDSFKRQGQDWYIDFIVYIVPEFLLMAQTWTDVYCCFLRFFFSNYCRFCTTGLPSDIIIEVGEVSFHLHKVNLTRPKQFSLVEVQWYITFIWNDYGFLGFDLQVF